MYIYTHTYIHRLGLQERYSDPQSSCREEPILACIQAYVYTCIHPGPQERYSAPQGVGREEPLRAHAGPLHVEVSKR